MGKALPNSLRRFIRNEKARIRREVLDVKEQVLLITQLYEKLSLKKTQEKKPRKHQPS